MRDEITGDFLGRGYDQRMRAENTDLHIYDSASLGGALLQSTTMDLNIGGSITFQAPDVQLTTWSNFVKMSEEACEGCFGNYWLTFQLNTILLAQNNTNIFMTGVKGDSVGTGGSEYQNLLYVLPKNGSCASQSCAISTVSLPILFNACDNCNGEARSIQVTSLAAGYIGQTPYLAVGLSDDGVQIYNVSNPSSPQLTGTFGGMATSDGSQAPVTALAWDPSGSGLLAVGVLSWSNEGFVVRVNSDGSLPGSWLTWSQQGTDRWNRACCRRRSGSARTAPRWWRSG